jgi:hypothetical protein
MDQHYDSPLCQWPDPFPKGKLLERFFWNTFFTVISVGYFSDLVRILSCELHYAKHLYLKRCGCYLKVANEFRCRGNVSGLATWVWALGRNPPSNKPRANMIPPTFADRASGDTESQGL